MSYRRLTLATLAVLNVAAACTPFPTQLGIPQPGARTPNQANGNTAKRPPLPARKIVAAKQEERNVLVAQDGTWCSVTASRYQRTQVGDLALCTWQT